MARNTDICLFKSHAIYRIINDTMPDNGTHLHIQASDAILINFAFKVLVMAGR